MSDTHAVEEPTEQPVHDPVCHMDISAAESAGSSEYEGHAYYFCSLGCKDTFEANPGQAVAAEHSFAHAS